MDHAIDIDDEQAVAARLALAALMGRMVEYLWKRAKAARIALHQKQVDAVRGFISQVVLMLLATARLIARWSRCEAEPVEPETARMRRDLHHPPQVWAAP